MAKGLYTLLSREQGERRAVYGENKWVPTRTEEREASLGSCLFMQVGVVFLSSLSHKTPLGRGFMVVLLLVSFQREVKATQKGGL